MEEGYGEWWFFWRMGGGANQSISFNKKGSAFLDKVIDFRFFMVVTRHGSGFPAGSKI